MIPYIQLISFHIGPLTIYVWGVFVALGIVAGTAVAARLAKQRGQNPKLLWDLATSAALAGIIGGRLFHVIFYDPGAYIAAPWSIFALWDGGISITGSMIGAVAALIIELKRRKLDLVAHLDTVAYGAPLAYGIGRIGCFLIHDHPGTLTHFLLGVRYPDGSIRHDLGFYEALNGFGMFLLFLVLRYYAFPPAGGGTTAEGGQGGRSPVYAIGFLLWYGLARFLLDFLRVADARYLGLTPAQYLAAGMFLGGAGWTIHRRIIKFDAQKRGA